MKLCASSCRSRPRGTQSRISELGARFGSVSGGEVPDLLAAESIDTAMRSWDWLRKGSTSTRLPVPEPAGWDSNGVRIRSR